MKTKSVLLLASISSPFMPKASRSRNPRAALALSIASVLATCSTSSAFAATWTTVGGGSWNTAGNWSGGTPNGTDAIADFSTLDITSDATVTLDGSWTAGTLDFGDTTPSNNWILNAGTGTGNTLTLSVTSGAPTINVVNQTATINAVLAGNQGFQKTGSGTLVLSGANTYTGGTNINGGTLVFASPGAFDTYNGGQININNGSTMQVSQVAGGSNRYDFKATTFNFDANGGGTISTVGATTNWVGQGTWTFQTNGGAKNTINGAAGINLNGQSVVFNVARGSDTASDLTVAVVVGNTTGTLTKTGSGILTLSAANNYTGNTILSAGTLNLSNASALSGSTFTGGAGSLVFDSSVASHAFTFAGLSGSSNLVLADNAGSPNAVALTVGGNNSTNTYSGALSGVGSLTKTGTGTLTLSGANNYTGGTTVTGGNLIFNAGAVPATGSITVSSGGALVASGAQTTIQGWLTSGLIPTTSTGALAIAANSSETIDFTGYNSLGLASSGNFTYSGTITPGSNGYLFGSNSATTLTVTSQLTGANSLTKSGSSALSFGSTAADSTNNYTGGTTINGGTVTVNTSIAAGAKTGLGSGAVTVNNATLTFFTNSTGAAQSYANNFALTNATFNSQDGVLTYGGTVSLSGANTINVVWGGKNATFNNIVSGTGSLTVTNTGGNAGGVVFLTGANTYTGGTTISSGTLSINTIKNTGTASSLGAPTTVANGTIAIGSSGSGATLSYTGTGDTTNRVINLAGTTGGATIDQSGTGLLKFTSALTATGGGVKTLTLQGSTAGTGEIAGAIVNNSSTNTTSVTKAGTGAWTLSGTNTYTGATAINAGTLVVSGSISGSTTTVANGATLAGTGTTGPVTVSSGGTITAGSTVGSLGTLNTGALNLSGTYKLTLNSTTNQSDDLNVTGNLTLSGATLTPTDLLSGPGGVNLTIAQFSGSLTGTFGGLAQGASVDGGLYTIDYGTLNAHAITLIAVPEPGALASLLGGFAMLAGLQRFRRRRIV